MNNSFNFWILSLFLLLSSCGKNDMQWDLERRNVFDVNFNKPCQIINGESLNNIKSYAYKISPSSNPIWSIGNGYDGNGFALTDRCYGGYIEFSITLDKNAKLTFWTKSVNPGYPNLTPEVTFDGTIVNTDIIDESQSNRKWMRLETGIIPSGNHSIRIDFKPVSTYFSYYIDEIEVWCP
ncbi:MAG: hypothetical protein P8O20_06870 [Bacteroidia bacterium]|nr:hypothetical protein [Bacteroidia bacterium]